MIGPHGHEKSRVMIHAHQVKSSTIMIKALTSTMVFPRVHPSGSLLFHLQLLQLSIHVVVALRLGLVGFTANNDQLGMNSPWEFFGWFLAQGKQNASQNPHLFG